MKLYPNKYYRFYKYDKGYNKSHNTRAQDKCHIQLRLKKGRVQMLMDGRIRRDRLSTIIFPIVNENLVV
jgi:hypothetical protein